MSGSSYTYNLAQAFEAVVAGDPDHPALVYGVDEAVSYAALNASANQIARLLLGLGVGSGHRVALLNHKTPLGFAAMLACLKIGATYTNLDDENPVARLNHMVETARPSVLVADQAPNEASQALAGQLSLEVVDLSQRSAELDDLSAENLVETDTVHGGLAAYLMFTSGSTGKPKGVAISHLNVLNFAQWAQAHYDIRPMDRLTNVNPIYFDNSVFDFYAALLSGASLAPFNSALVRQAKATIDHAEACGCTLWFSVPSLLIYLMRMKAWTKDSLPSLRAISFGGEGFPLPQLQSLRAKTDATVAFYNVYGPTECTCICSSLQLTDEMISQGDGLAPLGPIAPNFYYHVLDHDKPVPVGEIGELVLGGPQVGLGYFGEAEKTATAFPDDPLAIDFPARVYRTGDLVREDEHGWLYFVGRKDNQIKHMGYRIELDEIEAALNRVDAVVEAGVIYHREGDAFGRIIGFVAVSDVGADEAGLRDALQALLPAYMVPNQIVVLDSLPKSPNGKIDRNALSNQMSA